MKKKKNYHSGNNGMNVIITELNALSAVVVGVKRRIEEINILNEKQFKDLTNQIEKTTSKINSNVKRIAIQPVVRKTNNELNNDISNVNNVIKLMKKPTDLYELYRG